MEDWEPLKSYHHHPTTASSDANLCLLPRLDRASVIARYDGKGEDELTDKLETLGSFG